MREVPVSDHVIRYALSLVRQTRVGQAGRARLRQRPGRLGRRPAGRAVPDSGRQGPGAAARPHARLRPTTFRRWPSPVLRHRLVVNFAAESDGVTADKIIDRLIASTPTKEDELTSDARFQKIFAS